MTATHRKLRLLGIGCPTFHLILAALCLSPALAHGSDRSEASEWSIAFIVPFQFYQTQNDLGRSNSFALAGLGASLNRRIWSSLHLAGTYQVNLNAVTSAPIFSGTDLGVFWTLFGAEKLLIENNAVQASARPRHGMHIGGGFGQRSFDFGSVVSKEGRSLAEANDIELEGHFWSLYGRVRFDTSSLTSGSRWGTFLQYLTSLPTEALKTEVTIYSLGISYEFSLD